MTDRITPDELAQELKSPGKLIRDQLRECLEELQHNQGHMSGVVYEVTSSDAYTKLRQHKRFRNIVRQMNTIEQAVDDLSNTIEEELDELDYEDGNDE